MKITPTILRVEAKYRLITDVHAYGVMRAAADRIEELERELAERLEGKQ